MFGLKSKNRRIKDLELQIEVLETTARISEIKLQEKYASGMYEWEVE